MSENKGGRVYPAAIYLIPLLNQKSHLRDYVFKNVKTRYLKTN